jgi:hypothetical protein
MRSEPDCAASSARRRCAAKSEGRMSRCCAHVAARAQPWRSDCTAQRSSARPLAGAVCGVARSRPDGVPAIRGRDGYTAVQGASVPPPVGPVGHRRAWSWPLSSPHLTLWHPRKRARATGLACEQHTTESTAHLPPHWCPFVHAALLTCSPFVCRRPFGLAALRAVGTVRGGCAAAARGRAERRAAGGAERAEQ